MFHFLSFSKEKDRTEPVFYFICKMICGICGTGCFRKASVAVEDNVESGDSCVILFSLSDVYAAVFQNVFHW